LGAFKLDKGAYLNSCRSDGVSTPHGTAKQASEQAPDRSDSEPDVAEACAIPPAPASAADAGDAKGLLFAWARGALLEQRALCAADARAGLGVHLSASRTPLMLDQWVADPQMRRRWPAGSGSKIEHVGSLAPERAAGAHYLWFVWSSVTKRLMPMGCAADGPWRRATDWAAASADFLRRRHAQSAATHREPERGSEEYWRRVARQRKRELAHDPAPERRVRRRGAPEAFAGRCAAFAGYGAPNPLAERPADVPVASWTEAVDSRLALFDPPVAQSLEAHWAALADEGAAAGRVLLLADDGAVFLDLLGFWTLARMARPSPSRYGGDPPAARLLALEARLFCWRLARCAAVREWASAHPLPEGADATPGCPLDDAGYCEQVLAAAGRPMPAQWALSPWPTSEWLTLARYGAAGPLMDSSRPVLRGGLALSPREDACAAGALASVLAAVRAVPRGDPVHPALFDVYARVNDVLAKRRAEDRAAAAVEAAQAPGGIVESARLDGPEWDLAAPPCMRKALRGLEYGTHRPTVFDGRVLLYGTLSALGYAEDEAAEETIERFLRTQGPEGEALRARWHRGRAVLAAANEHKWDGDERKLQTEFASWWHPAPGRKPKPPCGCRFAEQKGLCAFDGVNHANRDAWLDELAAPRAAMTAPPAPPAVLGLSFDNGQRSCAAYMRATFERRHAAGAPERVRAAGETLERRLLGASSIAEKCLISIEAERLAALVIDTQAVQQPSAIPRRHQRDETPS
jgi:hypothetical protein